MDRRLERRLSEFLTQETAVQAGLTGRQGAEDPFISALEYDSRKVKPGTLYFALPGLHTDGHKFIDDAIGKGAVAVVHSAEIGEKNPGVVYLKVNNSRHAMSPIAAAFYGFPSQRLLVAGVTGTEGKSTTVYLIWQLLRLMGNKAGFFSTVQHSDGGEACDNPEHQTTPEATAVQRMLWEMAENGCTYAVVESSSHGLSARTNRLGDVEFDAAAFTNVTHEHLEFHGTWEQYRDDKANLFRALDCKNAKADIVGGARGNSASDDGVSKNGSSEDGASEDGTSEDGASEDAAILEPFGVINADDPSASYFAGATEYQTLSFSVKGKDADLSLKAIESNAAGNWYNVFISAENSFITIRDRLPGAFNAGNVLAALLVTSGLTGVPVRKIVRYCPRLLPVLGRMNAINKGQPFEVLVDYAHTPSSFQTIFPPLRKRLTLSGGRIISLFGSAGERDTQKRAVQGKIAATYSDCIVLADEDPRGEPPMAILEEIAEGIYPQGSFKRDENLFLIPDRPTAIRKALSLARAGDLVLLLGKAHENSIIYKDHAMPFDEISETEKALGELS